MRDQRPSVDGEANQLARDGEPLGRLVILWVPRLSVHVHVRPFRHHYTVAGGDQHCHQVEAPTLRGAGAGAADGRSRRWWSTDQFRTTFRTGMTRVQLLVTAICCCSANRELIRTC